MKISGLVHFLGRNIRGLIWRVISCSIVLSIVLTALLSTVWYLVQQWLS